MPSPFPGMDPFVESEEWEDFHPTFKGVMRELLAPLVEPHYFVRVERRVYVDHGPYADSESKLRPDVLMEKRRSADAPHKTATAVLPLVYEIPMPETRQESFLTIRRQETHDVVTVIETLSPSNKRPGSDGRRAYLAKREEILQSESHLVELDLLRVLSRLPIIGNPPGDYYTLVSRSYLRPKVEVYAWEWLERLPTIEVPLLRGDGTVSLDLQTAFDTVYDRARYHLAIDYRAAIDPPLTAEQRSWLDGQLAGPAPPS